jgi:hypothetical protein
MTGPEGSGPGSAERRGAGTPGNHHVELVGPHLRVRGRLSLGRFPRLADLINHNRGFIVLQDAELLERDGSAISLRLPELVVNQDEITFIGHEESSAPAGPGLARHLVIFTPGHTISGSIHIFREMTLANFVEATDPRFLSMTDTTARSLIDPSVLIRATGMLVNRTQINAIAETEQSVSPGGTADPAPHQSA